MSRYPGRDGEKGQVGDPGRMGQDGKPGLPGLPGEQGETPPEGVKVKTFYWYPNKWIDFLIAICVREITEAPFDLQY